MDPARPPLNGLALSAGSVADDVGFVALSDLGRVVTGENYRIIGGHMVMMLVARWALGPDLYVRPRTPPSVCRRQPSPIP
jgi:hypothetical protein